MQLWTAERIREEAHNCDRDAALKARLHAHEARAVYRETRALNLPRAPLYDALNDPKWKAKAPSLYAHGKRNALSFETKRAELDALLSGKVTPITKRTRKVSTCTNCPNCGYDLRAA